MSSLSSCKEMKETEQKKILFPKLNQRNIFILIIITHYYLTDVLLILKQFLKSDYKAFSRIVINKSESIEAMHQKKPVLLY